MRWNKSWNCGSLKRNPNTPKLGGQSLAANPRTKNPRGLAFVPSLVFSARLPPREVRPPADAQKAHTRGLVAVPNAQKPAAPLPLAFVWSPCGLPLSRLGLAGFARAPLRSLKKLAPFRRAWPTAHYPLARWMDSPYRGCSSYPHAAC